ncbi:MAG: hypothetical protein AAF467_08910 [Actinomycetota bacterium]
MRMTVERAAIAVLGIAMLALMVMLGLVSRSLGDTRNQLVEAQAELSDIQTDLDQVEENAVVPALVANQVLEISQQLVAVEPEVSAGFDEAIQELEAFSNATLEFQVAVDETVPIDTEITINRTLAFPVNETIAIDETVDTTITVETPLGFDVPVDVSVPVEIDVPINLTIDAPINETVPVATEVPIQLNVPVQVDVAETELKTLSDQLAASLRTLQTLVNELSVGT